MSNKKLTTINITSSERVQLIDITEEVSSFVDASGMSDGICYIFTPHTTAAVTINENADPDVKNDIVMGLEDIVSQGLEYDHSEGNSPAHIKSSMIGASLQVFVKDGRLFLGTWQGIYFCEFDGPRSRKVHIKMIEG